MNLLVTGGSGFIGSNFIEMALDTKRSLISKIVNLDALTYAGNVNNTEEFIITVTTLEFTKQDNSIISTYVISLPSQKFRGNPPCFKRERNRGGSEKGHFGQNFRLRRL